MPTSKVLNVDQIRIDGETQNRESINSEVVEEYAEIWREAGKGDSPFPPIDVFFDSTEYWCADGFHRLLGATQAKRASVPCKIHNGTSADAFVFGCRANTLHGLRRSNADKRHAALYVIRKCPSSTQKDIAEDANVSTRFIRQLLNELKYDSPDGVAEHSAVNSGGEDNTSTQIDGSISGGDGVESDQPALEEQAVSGMDESTEDADSTTDDDATDFETTGDTDLFEEPERNVPLVIGFDFDEFKHRWPATKAMQRQLIISYVCGERP